MGLELSKQEKEKTSLVAHIKPKLYKFLCSISISLVRLEKTNNNFFYHTFLLIKSYFHQVSFHHHKLFAFRYAVLTLFCCVEKPDVVLWVQGRLLDQQRRAVIRELLANKRAWPKDIRVTTFFAVGMCNSRKAHVSLQYEFEVFKDILQNDYHG